LNNIIFWNVMLCSPVVDIGQHFGGTYCLHLHCGISQASNYQEAKKQSEKFLFRNGNPGLCFSVTSNFLLTTGGSSSPGELVPFPWPLETRADFSLAGGSDIAIVTAIHLETGGAFSVLNCKELGILNRVLV
jgi:hypothetical protein